MWNTERQCRPEAVEARVALQARLLCLEYPTLLLGRIWDPGFEGLGFRVSDSGFRDVEPLNMQMER